MMRACGILLPVSSLPSRYGIGCFDKAAFQFVDALVAAGQSVWQILPLGPTGYGDSPYQPFSTFAGNPYFVSLEHLIEQGWLTEAECKSAELGADSRVVDYGLLYQNRFPLLRLAYRRSQIESNPDFQDFRKKNGAWLEDYALFMALKDAHKGASWLEWSEPLKMRETAALEETKVTYAEEIGFYQFVQFCFFQQWQRVLDYAHEKGVRILGDIPIYVSLDSADTWSNPELFQLDQTGNPTAVSGCPPDAFAADGQLWGNPLYDWDYHKKTGFAWWIERLRFCFQTCDILRIDHFRGFDEYFSIPAGDTTARNGHWERGPGIALFQAIETALGRREIVAEDLGYVTDSVRQLVKDTGFPSMKVFEFAFDSRDTGSASDYLPHNYTHNCVAYTGTHDNATLLGWLDEITEAECAQLKDYICESGSGKALCWPMICTVLRSVADLAIIPMQDYLGYGNEARMNQPSTNGSNWKWRLLEGEFSTALAEKLNHTARLYGRAPK